MNKETVYKGIILLLILLNVALVSFLVMGPQKGPGGPPPSDRVATASIKQNFEFDDKQIEQFILSRDKHARTMKALTPKLKEASLAYYQSSNIEQKDSLFQIADQYSDEIYFANNAHFEEVRAICRPDQLSKVNTFIGALMGRDENKGGRPRKK
ncbi:MAG: hypothetical protein Sapg2KO_26450 [Saprospiraceae bacterium]